MRKNRTIIHNSVKTISFILVMCMLTGLGGFAALADGADQDTPLVVNEPQGSVDVGNITIDVSNEDVTGVTVTSSAGTGGGTQTQTGDVSVTINADDGFWYDGTGIKLNEGANASNTIETGNIDVSVTVEDESATAFGIKAESKGGGHQTTIDTGDINVNASGDEYGNAVGIDIYSSNSTAGDGSSLKIAVDGDITVHNDLTTAQGVRMFNDEGTNNNVSITVNGDVGAEIDTDDSAELAEGLALTTEGSGNVTSVIVDGNVTANRRGASVITDGGGSVDMVVTGTISGDNTGIGFDGDVNADNTSVTTWKIESDGAIVDDLFGSTSQSKIATIAKEVIHYIVKLIQPDQGDILNAVKDDGSALDTKTYVVSDDEGEQTVMVGSEDEIVRLTLSDDKYEIVSAENTDGTQLDQDEHGFFYKIKRGGGILLSAILREKSSPEPAPEPEPSPEPDPKPEPKPSGEPGGDLYPCGIKVIYELDGGIYNGDNGPIIRYCYPGELIYLLDAPGKDGFKFDGWYREVNGEIKTYSAGDPFRPWTTVKFTAIWVEE